MNDTNYMDWLVAEMNEWMHDDETERLERIADLAVRVEVRMAHEQPTWSHLAAKEIES